MRRNSTGNAPGVISSKLGTPAVANRGRECHFQSMVLSPLSRPTA
jgi:hypothetical protein